MLGLCVQWVGPVAVAAGVGLSKRGEGVDALEREGGWERVLVICSWQWRGG